jgi:archaellum component FlaG (FlaF/FlaG flagellin family)
MTNCDTISEAARDMFDLLARGMYDAPAETNPELGQAFAIVRDAIDMAALPAEVVVEIVLGRRNLADSLDEAAELQAESLIDQLHGISNPIEIAETTSDCNKLCALLRAAATTLRSI